MPTLSERSAASGFEEVARLAYEQFGLELGNGKEGLVESRLGKKLRARGLSTLHEYCEFVRADKSGEALVEMIDALTTNHTSFFRESQHFDFLRQTAFPAWRGRSGLQFWSAACSSGEEPYTLAMILQEHFQPEASTAAILATDISTRVLSTAEKGLYREDSFAKPLPAWLKKYLLRGQGQWQGWYRIKPQVQKMIRYDRVNLVKPLPGLPTFAAIFCRNVMIYFDRPTQEQVVNRLAEKLEPGGYLLVGHSESLSGVKHSLEYVSPATYRKPGGSRKGAR